MKDLGPLLKQLKREFFKTVIDARLLYLIYFLLILASCFYLLFPICLFLPVSTSR